MAGRVLLTTKTGRMRHRAELNWVILAVSVILFAGATLDLFLGLTLTYNALVVYDGPGGAEHVFAHASSWQNFAKSICVVLQTLTGDFILIYRCWFIYHKSWLVVMLPVLIWLADVACAIGILVNQAKISQGQVNSGNGVDWGLSFFTLTISTNVVSTSLIVWRIWLVERQNKKFRPQNSTPNQPQSTLTHAMRNIVESGMVYTTCSILELAAFATGSTLNYPASALALQSVGITFNLILIRGAASGPKALESATSAIRLTSTAAVSRNTNTVGDTDTDDDKANVFALSRLQKDSY